MIMRRSAEQYLAELDEILRCYRAGEGSGQKLSEAEALARLKRLGFTTGEALRMLHGARDAKPL